VLHIGWYLLFDQFCQEPSCPPGIGPTCHSVHWAGPSGQCGQAEVALCIFVSSNALFVSGGTGGSAGQLFRVSLHGPPSGDTVPGLCFSQISIINLHFPSSIQEYIREKAIEDERRRVEQGSAQFFYDMQSDPNEEDPVDRGGRDKRKRQHQGKEDNQGGQRRPRIDPNTCWFCLSNVGTEKHLILTVGTHCYAAMPKGPLNERHLLVMSIGGSSVFHKRKAFHNIWSLKVTSNRWLPPLPKFAKKCKNSKMHLGKFKNENFKKSAKFSLLCDRNNEVLCIFERNYKTEVRSNSIGKHLQILSLFAAFANPICAGVKSEGQSAA
jgi:hypothetical protein